MNYQNNINTYADLTAYNADLNKEYPNISYIKGTDEVKWYKYDPDHIVAVYNVTSTESATMLLNSKSNITYQIIDGVQQSSVVTSYQFSTTGEHIVKYALTNNTYLYDGIFSNCSSLTSVTIPVGVITIKNQVFNRCSGLTSVTIPNSVTTFEVAVFQRAGLTSITFPSSVTTFGEALFQNCSSLTSVTIEATTPPTFGNNMFNNINPSPNIYVPAESVNAYKTASGWSGYASRIQAIPTT